MTDLVTSYQHKIKTIDELKKVIGAFPRKKKVIMCHGVFDVVHPGHVRHLLYAKGKADILVISITADIHIVKGKYRPHIPQDLRAVNLAAFEMVDYVVVDKHPTPLQNIEDLKPDYFAKGYEYVSDGLPPKTSEEAEVVESYGGQMIFTPGDFVFSSSHFINLAPPELKIEKVLMAMQSHGLHFDDLRNALDKFSQFDVHVVGDTIVDSYTETRMIGGQTKTPTISVLYEGRRDYIGGAAIVAKHLQSAGANVTFTTVLGNDEFKDFVLTGLEESGVTCLPVIDSTRVTTNKNAVVVGNYRLLKIDTLDNNPVSEKILSEMTDQIKKVKTDCVIFSDFRHGIFNRRTIPELENAIPKKAYRVADSQVASRWGNITEFRGFDLITPNEREARFALGDQDSGIRSLAANLYDAAECKTLILKLGDRGVLTCKNNNHTSLDSFLVMDSFVDRVVDAVGAGDALLAYATLAMLATKSEVIATILGSMAAACECECDGNVPVTPDLVRAKIDAIEMQARYMEGKDKKKGKGKEAGQGKEGSGQGNVVKGTKSGVVAKKGVVAKNGVVA